jgi:hypothetical protein
MSLAGAFPADADATGVAGVAQEASLAHAPAESQALFHVEIVVLGACRFGVGLLMELQN